MNTDRLLDFFGNKFHKRVFLICLIVAIILLVVSWVMPPAWVIDKSILAAVGELFGFSALGEVAAAVERGHSASITHGNTTISINKDEDEGEPQEGIDYETGPEQEIE